MDLLTINDQQGVYPRSYYAQTSTQLAPFAPAQGSHQCDICVIGAGFMGLSTALHLAQRGYKVIVVEAQRVGFGASGRNGGQVGAGQRVDQIELEHLVGRDKAADLWNLASQAVALVRTLSEKEEVCTHFQPGVINANHKARFDKDTRLYVDHLNQHYGHDQIQYLGKENLQALIGSKAYTSGTLDLSAGHLNPFEFTLGLARLARKEGAQIFENSRVVSITPGQWVKVKTGQAEIKSRYAVLGCNGYLGDLQPDVGRYVMPINNYILATQPLSSALKQSVLSKNYAVADSKFVVNYFRLSEDDRLLFGGTESYGYTFPKEIGRKVRKAMLSIFPQLQESQIDYAWGGTLGITMNRLPNVQRLEGNILSLSGFSGHGIANATLAGKIAAEAIAGQAERFDILKNLPNTPFPGGARFRTPLLVLAMLWFSLRDKL